MSQEENVDKIKSYIEDVLGTKSSLRKNYDPFYVAIENLLQLNYTEEQRNIMNWLLYDKFLPTGEVLVLTDKETEEIIPSDTPEDLWDLMQEHEKKNNK